MTLTTYRLTLKTVRAWSRGSHAATPVSEEESSSPKPWCRTHQSPSPIGVHSHHHHSPSVKEVHPHAHHGCAPSGLSLSNSYGQLGQIINTFVCQAAVE